MPSRSRGRLAFELGVREVLRDPPRPAGFAAALSAARLRLAAGCFGRSVALGVGPRPSSFCLPRPPDPTSAPFFSVRIAPLRFELPAITAPESSVHHRQYLQVRYQRHVVRHEYGQQLQNLYLLWRHFAFVFVV